MRGHRAGRAFGFVLAFFVLVLGGSGCAPPNPQEAAKSLAAAQTLEKGGRLEEAAKEYAHAAQLDRGGANTPLALAKAGELAMKTHHPDQAVAAYTTLSSHREPTQVKTSTGILRIPEDVEPLLDEAMRQQDIINSTRLTYKVMDVLVSLTGKNPAYSYWIAIFIFTIVLKAVLTPLTAGQMRSSRKMMLIQPRLKEIQDRYRDQPEELNRRMLALYKEEGVNPLGCGSGMIVQMVIMFALYRVILDYRYQFHQGHFLWIGSGLAQNLPKMYPGLAAQFGMTDLLGTSLAKPDVPLLIIYAISMFVQSRLTMVPTLDPQQAQQQKMMSTMMPLMLLVVLRSFPSAFALYWLLFNVLSTIQQLHINKQLDVEIGPRRQGGTEGSGEGGSGGGNVPKKPIAPPKKGPSASGKKNSRRK
jgi:YidC/Oxa1 family membrane protein insertase